MLLRARGLSRSFGGIKAVDNVNFDLARGAIHALIGPNGAGKSTLVGLICGRIRAGAGMITFNGSDITRLPAEARVRLGIAYTFQITSIYPRLRVYDNVALAAQRSGRRNLELRTMGVLSRVGLDAHAERPAGTLSYGHQRLLEFAMGLALKPKLLILDEPTQGLADDEIETFKRLVRGVALSASVLLIEHNMQVVMDVADRITLLDQGRKLAEGTPEEIRADAAAQAAYLGG